MRPSCRDLVPTARTVAVLLGALLTGIAVSQASPAQSKRPVNHDDYDRWPSIRATAYSADGTWLAYQVQPGFGDGVLHVREVDGKARYQYRLGSGPQFSADGRYLVFAIGKSVEEAHRKKLDALFAAGKGKAASSPKSTPEAGTATAPSGSRSPRSPGRRGGGRPGGAGAGSSGKLGVMNLADGKVEVVDKTRSFRLLQKGALLAYHRSLPKDSRGSATRRPDTGSRSPRRARPGGGRGAATRGGARSGAAPTPSRAPSGGASGSELVLRDLATGVETRYPGVASFQTFKKDEWLLLTLAAPAAKARDTSASGADTEAKEKDPATTGKGGLAAIHLPSGRRISLFEGAGSFQGFTADRYGRMVAFTTDTTDKQAAAARAKKGKGKAKAAGAGAKAPEKPKSRSEIFLWKFGEAAPQCLVGHDAENLPEGFSVQPSGLSFSADGSVLSFQIRGKPEPEQPKILPEEKVAVDIWHWNDGYIQSMQAKGRGRISRTRSCALHLDSGGLVVLGDEEIPSVRLLNRDGSRALATSSKNYEKLTTWDGSYSDVYLVNTINGERTRLLTRLRGRTQSSPTGRYVLYFGEDYQWYSIDIETQKRRCLTEGLDVHFENVLADRPQPSSAYGVAGWTRGDKQVLIYDRYDLWKFDLGGGDPVCVTDGYGRANQIVLRYQRFDLEGDDEDLDPDDRGFMPASFLLNAKNDATKARGYFTDSLVGTARPKKLVMLDRAIGGLARARSADRVFFTLSTFAEFPDIWVADLDFSHRRKLTDACPIQKDVTWGSSELVTWTNSDGVALQGILVKPEGFDPKRKYPMMVYFYERNSDNLHRYTKPAPGTSPNAAYYVSNGYLWFVPDICYTVGYPGESAEKCILPGVQHMIAQGFVDPKAIGMAGHSWGGYQTAHLITRSNLFAAAESGAPVSNMFSAYGGIRYQSGMSRQFQYERTQSRIGGTPWQYPQRYWQNSPLFYADRVQTPVLLLHNDNDGAVPWTNGLEFFMALRRLGKEAYLFNYNGEPHGLRKKQNQRDWSRRMAEFFDHHLRGRPAPEWMVQGVPFADRDREKLPYAPSYRERQRRKAAAEASSSAGSRTTIVEGGNGNDRR